MKLKMHDYMAEDWRKLHDEASRTAKNMINKNWTEPLMQIAKAAMELEELVKKCTTHSGEEPDQADYWKDV